MISVRPKFAILCVLTFFSTYLSAATRLPSRPFFSKPINPKSSPATKDPTLNPFYYTQTLDHFNYRPDSYTTFQHRYFMSSKHWGGAKMSSPIFVYLGAEANIENDVAIAGFIYDLAIKFNGLVVFIEHRYYGESIPFGSFEEAYSDAETLGYFTSAQALADYAEVIGDLKKNLSANSSPVIVMGASYGGMLASWFRLKYPHVAVGALASSAPILYLEDLTPQDQYYVTVTDDFKEASKTCVDTIKQSWSKIDKIASKSNGVSVLSKMFKTCTPLESVAELKSYLEGIYTQAAQYDAPPSYPVNMICKAIDGASKTNSPPFSKILAGVAARKGNQSCYNTSEIYANTKDGFGWIWQTCTDIIFPMGRDRDNTMFPVQPFVLEDKIEFCSQQYGITPRAHWTLTEFGGRDIKTVLKKFGSNIIFSNGLRDPFSHGGILENISDTIVAIYTKQGSHSLDMFASSSDDPKWLVEMRAKEIKVIKSWLAEYYAIKATTQ